MKWKTLQHNGIAFLPPYESKGITIKIKGEKVPLSIDAEEMAYQWAKKKDTPYVKDHVFQKNFFAAFVNSFLSLYYITYLSSNNKNLGWHVFSKF